MRAGSICFQLLIYLKGENIMRNEEIGKIVLLTNSEIKSMLAEPEVWKNDFKGVESLSEFERENCENGNKNYLVVLHDPKDDSIIILACIGNRQDVNYDTLRETIKTLKSLTIEMMENCDQKVIIDTTNIPTLDEDIIIELFRIYFMDDVFSKFEFSN
jgi:hypothetical protein